MTNLKEIFIRSGIPSIAAVGFYIFMCKVIEPVDAFSTIAPFLGAVFMLLLAYEITHRTYEWWLNRQSTEGR